MISMVIVAAGRAPAEAGVVLLEAQLAEKRASSSAAATATGCRHTGCLCAPGVPRSLPLGINAPAAVSFGGILICGLVQARCYGQYGFRNGKLVRRPAARTPAARGNQAANAIALTCRP